MSDVERGMADAYDALHHPTKFPVDKFLSFYGTLAEAHLRQGEMKRAGAAFKIAKDKIMSLPQKHRNPAALSKDPGSKCGFAECDGGACPVKLRVKESNSSRLSKLALHLHTLQLPETVRILHYISRSGVDALVKQVKKQTRGEASASVRDPAFPCLSAMLAQSLPNVADEGESDLSGVINRVLVRRVRVVCASLRLLGSLDTSVCCSYASRRTPSRSMLKILARS